MKFCIAPSFSPEAEALLTKKPKRILLKWSKKKYEQDIIRSCLNGILVQQRDLNNVQEPDLNRVTKLKPSDSQLVDLIFADRLVKNTKSNAIILVKKWPIY